MSVVFVHGACVRDGAWWWHRTAELLDRQGVRSAAALLPSCGETGAVAGADGPGLAEDAAALRRLLTEDDEPAVVVAHSYGGIVAAEAAGGLDTVRHLLLISSYLPEIGQSLSDFSDDKPAPFLDIDPGSGTFGVRPDLLQETFLQDCAPEVTRAATTRLARQSLRVTGQPVSSAAWQQIPTTYLVCTRDNGTSAQRQREYARRADHVADIDAGHHPFLSQPADVAELLLGL